MQNSLYASFSLLEMRKSILQFFLFFFMFVGTSQKICWGVGLGGGIPPSHQVPSSPRSVTTSRQLLLLAPWNHEAKRATVSRKLKCCRSSGDGVGDSGRRH